MLEIVHGAVRSLITKSRTAPFNAIIMWAGTARLVYLLGSLSCVMPRRRFDPPLGRNFPVECISPLELTWVLTPFPCKNLMVESINRGLICACMHSIARTQKILTFMSEMGECRQQKKQKKHAAYTIQEDGM